MNRDWYNSPAHDSGRSIHIIRVVLALVLTAHPAYALMHPHDIREFGAFLSNRHLPFGFGLAWAVIVAQCACSVALLVWFLIVPACLGQIFILLIGIPLVHAARWRSVGLPDGVHQPGAEFSVLLICCLLAVLYAYLGDPPMEISGSWGQSLTDDRALEFVRIASASILIVHPLGGLRDPAGLNDLGQYFSSLGFPFGTQLVWGSMFLQIFSSIALILRRFVVPACLGHILVLYTGACLFHAPHWFVVGPNGVIGPGHEGMEYSTLLITCFVSILLAYWPTDKAETEWPSSRR